MGKAELHQRHFHFNIAVPTICFYNGWCLWFSYVFATRIHSASFESLKQGAFNVDLIESIAAHLTYVRCGQNILFSFFMKNLTSKKCEQQYSSYSIQQKIILIFSQQLYHVIVKPLSIILQQIILSKNLLCLVMHAHLKGSQ